MHQGPEYQVTVGSNEKGLVQQGPGYQMTGKQATTKTPASFDFQSPARLLQPSS